MPLNDKLEVIQFLIDYGLDVNQMNLNNKTALTTAMDMMESEIANLLIDNGARIFKNINVYDKLHDFHSVKESLKLKS
jgi:ankyrin repeat protein